MRDIGVADTIELTYDAAGRITDVIDHKGGTVTFAYNVDPSPGNRSTA